MFPMNAQLLAKRFQDLIANKYACELLENYKTIHTRNGMNA